MRLIDADALCRYANNLKDKQIDANDIMRFPRVDAVEVVRCKDCKYYGTEVGGVPTKGYCKKTEFMTKNDNDFCSWGEKR